MLSVLAIHYNVRHQHLSYKQSHMHAQVIIAQDSSASSDANATAFQALLDAVHAPFAPGKAILHIDRVRNHANVSFC